MCIISRIEALQKHLCDVCGLCISNNTVTDNTTIAELRKLLETDVVPSTTRRPLEEAAHSLLKCIITRALNLNDGYTYLTSAMTHVVRHHNPTVPWEHCESSHAHSRYWTQLGC